ncbi:MAG: 50S ribosomal protein L16 [Candidatus Woesebacteria bacterium]|nr:50S ribosomal protein L16 [Candidatus Woesebacteria bacterium]
MLQPKREKFTKSFRGRRRGTALRGSAVSFGDYGLKAMGVAWVSAAQIEAARKAITHHLKRGGKVWIRVFPDKPISGRAAGKRMGGGKGDVQKHVAVVKPGRILFEVAGAPEKLVKEAFIRAGAKLPIATKMVEK